MSTLIPTELMAEDFEVLHACARPEDRREVRSASGREVESAVAVGYLDGAVTIVARDSETGFPVFAMGVVELYPGIGSPWLIATTEAAKHRRQIVKHARAVADVLNRRWPILVNRVDLRNAVHIKWLRRAGFRFGDIVKAPDGQPFITFTRTPDV